TWKKDFGKIWQSLVDQSDHQELVAWAEQLGVSVEALERIPTAASSGELTWPERDADGNITAVGRRLPSGEKKQVQGGKRGLIIPPSLYHTTGTIFAPEGASDLAALLTLGLRSAARSQAYSRASVSGLVRLSEAGEVFIVADNDEHGIGEREAKKTAQAVADEIRKPVQWAKIPDPYKDARAWLLSLPIDLTNLEHCSTSGEHLAESLLENASVVEPQETREKPDLADDNWQTETSFTRRLVMKSGDDIRYCGQWKKYLVWDGKRWALDIRNRAEQITKTVADDLWQELPLASQNANAKDITSMIRFIKQCNSSKGIRAALHIARSEPSIAVDFSELNTDPWLFNAANGTIDLKTGNIRPHNRRDMLTNIAETAFDPEAKCPRWLDFLGDITNGDADLQGFLQRAAGMSLSGQVRDHVLLYCYGTGGNGKSVFLNTLMEVFGNDYSMKAMPELLLSSDKSQHPTHKADLFGRRIAVSIEADDGQRFNEATIKELTGGDPIRARRCKEDTWEFLPTHTIWIAANHKITIRGQDEGIWRRVKMIPFTVTIPPEKQDDQLPEKLKRERAGILAWAVRGCLDWQRSGLAPPEAVTSFTDAYKDEQDIVQQFIDEQCYVSDASRCSASELFKAFNIYCKQIGVRPPTQTAFGSALTQKGFDKVKNSTTFRLGLALSTRDLFPPEECHQGHQG
ncbi:MAG: phage/plasmid primase, P4 family, partial [Pirellulales bacterium]